MGKGKTYDFEVAFRKVSAVRTTIASIRGTLHNISTFAIVSLVEESEPCRLGGLVERSWSCHGRCQIPQLHFVILLQDQPHGNGLPKHGEHGQSRHVFEGCAEHNGIALTIAPRHEQVKVMVMPCQWKGPWVPQGLLHLARYKFFFRDFYLIYSL